MSKTKNHRKLRKRRGGDPVPAPLAPLAPAPALGQPAPVLGQPAPVLGQPAATGTETNDMFSPPKIDPTTPQRPPGPPSPVQGTGPAPVPPPTPSFWDKLTSPFKKKEESSSEATSTSPGWFSSKFKWFGGKSRKHGKNKKSNKKSKKSRKSKKSNKH